MPTSHLQTQNSKKIFLWIESILTSPLRFFNYLSLAEKERAAKYHSQQLQDRFIAARGRLREILGNHLGISPNHVEFTYNAFGKPSIHPKHRSSIQFNLSHSHDRLAIALTENARIGIDIERHSNTKDFSKIIFSKQELQIFNNLPEHDQIEQLFRAWTLKEAYLKALGCGLTIDLRTVEVLLDNRPKDIVFTPWTLRTLPMETGWAGAIAVETPNLRNCSLNGVNLRGCAT